MPSTSAKQQLYENIRRDHNKASVILWSVSNETPKSEERLVFLKALIDEAHQQDPTRLVTSALLTHMDGKTGILDDPLGQYVDVIGVKRIHRLVWRQARHRARIHLAKPL